MTATTSRTRKTKTAAPITVEFRKDDGSIEYTAVITPGESITVRGRRASSRPSGRYVAGWKHADAPEGLGDWCRRLCYTSLCEFGELLNSDPAVAGDWIEDNGGRREWHPWLAASPLYETVYEPTEQTYRVGDSAEHGSYNLSYIGEILSITPKTVTIKDHDRTRRLPIREFCWRNLEGVAVKLQRNSEWYD